MSCRIPRLAQEEGSAFSHPVFSSPSSSPLCVLCFSVPSVLISLSFPSSSFFAPSLLFADLRETPSSFPALTHSRTLPTMSTAHDRPRHFVLSHSAPRR